nr:DUF3040 domain-containing protein [Corynebacterium lactis]
MGLSEQEQRMLDEIESALYAEDPKFGSTMSGRAFSLEGEGGPKRGFSLQVIALILLGLLMLLGGVALFTASAWFIALSVAGFVLMFGAGVWALTGHGEGGVGSRASASGVARSRGGAFGAGGNAKGARSSRGSSLESRFRGRFEGR